MPYYNSEFSNLLSTITPIVKKSMSKYAWVSFINGYYNGRNDSYFIGFKQSGRMFPIVIIMKFTFPWSFVTNYDRVKSYNYKSGNGKLEFDKKFTFSLSIEKEYIDRHDLDGVKAEFDEFKDIPTEKLFLDLTNKPHVFKKFNKKDENKIGKWAEAASKNLLLNIQPAISKQITRRFDEFVKVDEQLTIKYTPPEIKDIFIF